MQTIQSNDPLLHRPSQPVSEEQMANGGEQIKPIAAILIKTMKDRNALGVSACQIGIDMAMFATYVDGVIRICVNPLIVASATNMEKQPEGCLSFPGLYLKVNRPDAAVVRYHNVDGVEVTEHLDGLSARVWLHEYDHTMGICFTDRVSKLSLDMAKRRLNKQNKRGGK
jgi:peptide deformylase